MLHQGRILLCCVSVLLTTAVMVAATPPAQAKLIDNLYSAEVEVSSQSRQARQTAIANAFNRVLVKLTGQPEILNQQAIRQARGQVSNFLVQYGYSSNQGQQTLTATFDGKKLRQLLADNQLPYWGSRRPELLAWLAIEGDTGRRQLIDSSNESIFIQQLRFYARQSGVPLQLPLMDLTDAQKVSATDVWGRFMQPIKAASERYYPDGVLVAKITEHPQADDPEKRAELDWQIEVDDLRLSGTVFASSDDWLAEPFITDLQQQLAENYGVMANDNANLQTVPITVAGLADWQSVLQLEEFLTSVDSVQSVQLTQYSAQQSNFTVAVRGNGDHLLQAIQLDGRLQHKPIIPFAEPEEKERVVYRWINQ